MPAIVDPSVVLPSLQQALDNDSIQIYPCALDKMLFHLFDLADGVPRMSYLRLSGDKQVMSLVQFFNAEPYEGVKCFDAGWAVPQKFRGAGLAVETFLAAVRELQNTFFQQKQGRAFYIEAIVGSDNLASRKTAEKVFGCSGESGIDSISGCAVLQYFRRIEASTSL